MMMFAGFSSSWLASGMMTGSIPKSLGSSGIMILAIRMPPGADMKLAASR